MDKRKTHIYGLHLELNRELSVEEYAGLKKIFEQTAKESIAKLKLKERPKVDYPVKPPRPTGR